MKTINLSLVIPIIAACMLGSCNTDYVPEVDLGKSRNEKEISRHYNVSFSDINKYLTGYKNLNPTKGDDVKIDPILSGEDTVLYLINYPEGWELLSADTRAPRVFAKAEKGNITVKELTEVPAANALLEGFIQKILYIRQNPDFETGEDYQEGWDGIVEETRGIGTWTLVGTTITEYYESTPHLLRTEWGQSSPWNIRAPFTSSALTDRCVTGCVPVAAAQILFYLHDKYNYPEQTYGDCSHQAYIPTGSSYLILQPTDVSFNSATYSSSTWDSMPLKYTDTGSFAAVSTLMVEMGIYIEALYYWSSTWAYSSMVESAFENHFLIPCVGTPNVNLDTVIDQIFDEEMPVYLGLSEYENNHWIMGHGVVADAAQKLYRKEVREYVLSFYNELTGAFEENHRFSTQIDVIAKYIGINWGWNGSNMYSGGQPIYYNTEAVAWTTGFYTWNHLDYMVYGFSI